MKALISTKPLQPGEGPGRAMIVKTDGLFAALVQMSVSPAPEQCTVLLSLSQIRSWSWPGLYNPALL